MEPRLDAGAHVCHLYERPEEQKQVTLQLLKQGLDSGEAAIHVTASTEQDDWFLELQAFGVDVREAIDSRRLKIIESRDWYWPDQLNSLLVSRRLWRTISSPLNDFAGVRMVSDMTWTIGSPMAPDQLCHWEATKNLIFEDLNVRVICQYDLQRHSVPELHAALRTHPLVILDGRLVVNLFHEAQQILDNEPRLNTPDDDPKTLAAILATLRAQPALG
jgi:hypothetical protein